MMVLLGKGSFWLRRTTMKRWPDEKSWENDEKPQSIWPDGRIRK
jgi:hypothetical protein